MKVIAIAPTSAGCVRRTVNGRSATPLQPRVAARTFVASVSRSRPGARVVLAASSSSNAEYVEDSSFSIAKVSFGTILAPVGVGLMTYGFGAFFTLLPGGDLSSLLLIYGFPLMLLGFALKYAELEPVPCKTTRQALDLRDTQMTDIQKQVREDCTRFRYGDEQHLEEALQRVFKLGRQTGLPKKLCPRLVGLREEVRDSNYTLVMEFESLPELTEEIWMEYQPKIQTFFGPGIVADLLKTEAGAEVALISDGSGSGRGGPEQKDALPPLMPGLPARQG